MIQGGNIHGQVSTYLLTKRKSQLALTRRMYMFGHGNPGVMNSIHRGEMEGNSGPKVVAGVGGNWRESEKK